MEKFPEKSRWAGSLFLVAGYVLLVAGNPAVGLPIRLLGNVAMLPFAIKLRMTDVVVMQIFFGMVTGAAMVPSMAAPSLSLPPAPPAEVSQNHYGI